MLDEFFTIMELHESQVVGLEEKVITNHNIVLIVELKESDLDSLMDGNHEAYLVRKKWILISLTRIRRVDSYKEEIEQEGEVFQLWWKSH